jgi:glycosyltransferase involved in cell wall biosynthesis
MTIRFSVALPVWNDAEWLPGAIGSVLAQSYPHWELVIGDNASDQDLASVVATFADSRIRYHRWPTHVGASENYNRTMSLCTLDWVQVLSADDRLDPCCFELMAQRIQQVRAEAHHARLAMIVTACRWVDACGQPESMLRTDQQTVDRPSRLQTIPDGVYDAPAWLRVNAQPGVPPWTIGSVAIARDLLTEVGGFRPEMGTCHDLELAMRIAAYGEVIYLDRPLLNSTVRGDSASRLLITPNVQGDTGMVQAGAAWLSALRAHEECRPVSRSEKATIFAAISRAFLQRALLHRRASDGDGVGGALRDVLRAARYSPRTVFGSWRVLVALGAIFAPKWLLRRATVLGHRRGYVVL